MEQLQVFFKNLFESRRESHIDGILLKRARSFSISWSFLGDIESNFSVVENQQSSPIPALVEKVINSIDAILMRRCFEEGIDPCSLDAPRSVEKAVKRFFPKSGSWDLSNFRRQQAERIQVLADGPKMDTSLIIYDDGEGQHPEDFEKTFLSLLRGNKNEIHFVQGKYNMGGAGAIAFCGKRRYQLIGSKRYDGSGEFGFTLIRRHPLTPEEKEIKKNTWYEYLVVDGKIPSFPIEELDLGLHNRKFTTGTVIKLYSYSLPPGSRSVISRDLNQSLNEYLFSPALPILTVDRPERYPDDRNLQRELYGLRRRLEDDKNKYVQESFSQELTLEEIGPVKVTCYVFKARIEDKNAKDSRESIRREFFKNNMAVVFSVNGQVHGHYTSEFISRSLKMQILKDYLLIHVDCTDIEPDFRNELFMASRDRVKEGEESQKLRKKLADILSNGRLQEIYKERKSSLTVESKDTEDLIRNFTRDLPLQNDLMRLLGQAFKLQGQRDGRDHRKKQPKRHVEEKSEPAFHPQRFPSFFKIERKAEGGITLIKIPHEGEKTIRFSTDVEDQYFDRISEPGELKLAVLSIDHNESTGGTEPGLPDRIENVLNVVKSSPHNGTIRVTINPTQTINVGDTIKLQAQLTGAGENFEEIFLVKIIDPEKQQKKAPQGEREPDSNFGLPRLELVYEVEGEEKERMTWDRLGEVGIDMDHSIVMCPHIDNDTLTTVYINMNSSVLQNYRSKLKNVSQSQIEIGEKRYISSVYFHTLFLYMITRNKKYTMLRERNEGEEPELIELGDYLKDLFSSYYAEFLLNFEMQDLIASIGD